MDIALGGIVILVILLPGLLFRKGYFSEEFSNQYTVGNFFRLFLDTLFPSIITYILFLPIIYYGCGYYYDIELILGVLSSDSNLVAKSIKQIDFYSKEILLFQLVINAVAFGAGYWLKSFVLKNSYDARSKFLRYKNVWHYILSAKYILFKRSQIDLLNNTIEDIDFTFVDALVDVGDKPILYTGVLVDYELARDGGLDLLYLKFPQRKVLDSKCGFKEIEGNTLVLKYNEIINLNFSFIQVELGSDNDIKYKLID